MERVPSPKEIEKNPTIGRFKLAPQHYEAIGGIKDAKLQREVAEAAVEHGLPAHQTKKLVSLVKKGLLIKESLKLIAGGRVETESVVMFACKKCKTPYHVDWDERMIKPIE